MNIKRKLTELRQWQEEAYRYRYDASERHQCQCCGEVFAGNFCPACGQPASKGKVTWNSVREGVMDIWGLGSRSLPFTIWQLMSRPGHLIADYISGKRQVSFPPVKMLVIIALMVYLISNFLLGGGNTSTPAEQAPITDGQSRIDFYYSNFINWISGHYDWISFIFLSSMIFPTWVMFKYSPRCGGHNLPQGFFIPVFNSVQLLLLFLLICIIFDLISIADNNYIDMITFALLIISMLYRTYKQLFGYSVWGTVWRLIFTIVSGFTLFLSSVAILFSIITIWLREWEFLIHYAGSILTLYGGLTAVTLAAGYYFNRLSLRRQNQA